MKPDENDLKDDLTNSENITDGGATFLHAVSETGVDYIFYNPGSDYYPILEHLSEWEIEGRNKPSSLMCLSEQLALSMAHGYSMKSGSAQLVLVHVGIGLLQLGGELHNVHRGRAPVLIASGRAPYTFENEMEGGKDSPHHWDQELFDQSSSVREYTKWQYELKTNTNVKHIVNRALQVANSEPRGPVYLTLPRELLAEKFPIPKNNQCRPKQKYSIPTPPDVDITTLEKITRFLLSSEKPIIITEYLGRNEKAIGSLVALSEALAIGVMELSRRRTNFPTTHPNYLPAFPREDLESADLILLLDVDVPWIPSTLSPRSDAKVIQIDIDPVKSEYPLWGFPVDISATGSTETAIPKLVGLIEKEKRDTHDDKSQLEERAQTLASRHTVLKSKLQEAAKTESDGSILVEAMLSLINDLKRPDSIIVNEGVSYTKTVENYIDSTLPSTFFGLGGSSIGHAMGNALGLKLASPSQEVICITGDGSFIYSNPITTFWQATKSKLPTLTILINNGGYAAMKRSVDKFYPRGTSKRNNNYAGVRIDPAVDYARVADACGVEGWRVEKSEQMHKVFSEAFRKLRCGIPSLVEIVTART